MDLATIMKETRVEVQLLSNDSNKEEEYGYGCGSSVSLAVSILRRSSFGALGGRYKRKRKEEDDVDDNESNDDDEGQNDYSNSEGNISAVNSISDGNSNQSNLLNDEIKMKIFNNCSIASQSNSSQTLLPTTSEVNSTSSNMYIISRFLFNCGEGIQRSFVSKRFSTLKLQGAFITRFKASHLIGINGILFSMADCGGNKFSIRGPTGIEEYIESSRSFVKRRWPEIDTCDMECDKDAKFAHKTKIETFSISSETTGPFGMDMKIISITLRASKNQKDGETTTSKNPDPCCAWCAMEAKKSNAASGSKHAVQPKVDQSQKDDVESEDESEEDEEEEETCYDLVTENAQDVSICYIVRLIAKKDDTSLDICSFCVIDCPKGLENELHIHPHLQFTCGKHRPQNVFHIGHSKLSASESHYYSNWIARLNECNHIFLGNATSSSTCPVLRDSTSFILNDLLSAQPKFYNLFNNVEEGKDEEYFIQPYSKFCLFPKLNCIQSIEDIDTSECTASVRKRQTVSNAIDPNEISIDDDNIKGGKEESEKSFKITILGTGASKPSRLRGLTSILLNVDETCTVLFDVGEGSFGQMCRYYGYEKSIKLIGNLDMIWISHAHLDHHGGIVRILDLFVNHSKRDSKNPLKVYAPHSLLKHLTQSCSKQVKNVKFHHCKEVESFSSTKIKKAYITNVDHCFDSYALAMDISYRDSIVQVVYSGDLQPCDTFNRFLLNLKNLRFASKSNYLKTILIHESTFDASMDAEARKKKHSTVSEAEDSCTTYNGDLLILTHFSQRYPKMITQQQQNEKENEALSSSSATSNKKAFDILHAHDLFTYSIPL